ncbi:MAG: helix-turn-helix transcriptional regulator [Bacilli bacterium]|nr:helix-turn-helix transcriptional regulator [Bacilli bacterium]
MISENEAKIKDEEFELICKYIQLRYKSNISQRELAKRIGIAQSTVARMEKNMHSMSLGNFIKILSVLGYKLDIIEKGSDYE